MSNTQFTLNRAQLSQFLTDPRTIKAFEQMFTVVNATIPESIESAQYSGESFQNQITEVVNSIAALAALVLTQPPIASVQNTEYTTLNSETGQQDIYVPPVSLNSLAEQAYTQGGWTPTIGATTGAITSTNISYANYVRIGDIVHINYSFTITNNGTGTGAISITMPFVAKTTSVGYFRETNFNGKLGSITIDGGTSNALMVFYDNAYPGITSHVFVGNLTYGI